jgi:hypothetical protein
MFEAVLSPSWSERNRIESLETKVVLENNERYVLRTYCTVGTKPGSVGTLTPATTTRTSPTRGGDSKSHKHQAQLKRALSPEEHNENASALPMPRKVSALPASSIGKLPGEDNRVPAELKKNASTACNVTSRWMWFTTGHFDTNIDNAKKDSKSEGAGGITDWDIALKAKKLDWLIEKWPACVNRGCFFIGERGSWDRGCANKQQIDTFFFLALLD